MIIWRDPQKHRKSRPENHAFVLLNYLAWRWSRFTTEITLLNLLLLFFFAFSLLRTKRLIPVHQCTMHTGSFAHLFFQNSEEVEKNSHFWWNLSFITLWMKNSRPNQQILISWAFSHIWSLKTSSGDGIMVEWKKLWAEILVCHGT